MLTLMIRNNDKMAGASDEDMMKIGAHCNVSTCGQLDFLPVTCNHCKNVYCKEHSSTDRHSCTEVADNVRVDVPVNVKRNFVCDFKGCSQSELTEVICEHCKLNFCFKHRHQVDHECTEIVVPEEKMKASQEHVQKLKPKEKPQSRGRKSSKTSAKVLLMKLKMKAVGDKSIPDTEKTYLLIAAPMGSKEKNKAVIVSNKWSIGRVIDTAASLMGLANDNNKGGAMKLKMFHCEDGHAFDTSQQLSDTGLESGSVAVLEYVDNSATLIDNLQHYSLGY